MKTLKPIFYLLPCFLLLSLSSWAQNADTLALWQKVLEANRAWLFTDVPSMYYELEKDQMGRLEREKIWYRSPDSLYHETTYRKEIYYKGEFFQFAETYFNHLYHTPVPAWVRNGQPFRTSLQYAADYGVTPPGLIRKGLETIAGQPVVVLESPRFAFQMRDGVNRELYLPFHGATWHIDPQRYLLVREILDVGEADPFFNGKITITVSDGFYATPNGPAPRALAIETQNELVSGQVAFQLHAGKHWIMNHSRLTIPAMRRSVEIRIANLSPEPIPLSFFEEKIANAPVEPATGPGIITGTVCDLDTRQPIPNARVWVDKERNKLKEPGLHETTTDTHGAFTFTNLPLEPLYVLAEKKGFVSSNSREATTNYAGSLRVTCDPQIQSVFALQLHKNKPEQTVELFLAKERTVHGTVVTDADGAPVPNAVVYLCDQVSPYGFQTEPQTVRTDANGAFQFKGLSATAITLFAEAEGYSNGFPGLPTLRSGNTLRQSQLESVSRIDLTKQATTDGIVLKLYPDLSLAGSVKNSDDQSIAKARITYPPFRTVFSDDEGRFEITGLTGKETQFGIVVTSPGYVQTQLEIDPKTTRTVEVVLQRGGRLRGTVVDEADQPLEGIELCAIPQSKLQPRMGDDGEINPIELWGNPGLTPVISDASGAFTTDALLPGSYGIRAGTEGYESQMTELMELEDEQTQTVEIQLIRAKEIAGVVLDPTGQPLADIEVRLHLTKENSSRQNQMLLPEGEIKKITGADGKFVFSSLPNLTFLLQALWNRENCFMATAFTENVRTGQKNIPLQFLSEPEKKCGVKGMVVDAATGLPIPEFTVYALDADRSIPSRFTDPGGVFHYPKLWRREHEFVISAPGYAIQEAGPIVCVGETDKELFISLHKANHLKARLVGEDGIDPQNARIYLKRSETARALQSPWIFNTHETNQYGMTTTLSASGDLEIQNIPNGTYDLLIRAEQYGWKELRGISLAGQETTDLGEIMMYKQDRNRDVAFVFSHPDGTLWDKLWGTIPQYHIRTDWPNYRFENGRFAIPSTPDILNTTQALRFGRPSSNPNETEGNLAWIAPVSGENRIVYEAPTLDARLICLVRDQGAVLKQAKVTLVSDPRQPWVQCYTQSPNELGRYHFAVPAGVYWLLVRKEEQYTVFSSEKPSPLRFVQGEIPPGGEPFIAMDFGNGARLKGVVKAMDGQPVAGAFLSLRPEGFPPAVDFCFLENMASVVIRSDEHGLFTFSDLQPGTYTLRASRLSIGVAREQQLHIEGSLLQDNDPKEMTVILE
ncbi:MAG: carboxypeptidase-like regulatory domain-containing protein [bacterium]|jgi:protocatechuate 3,4-dioxygenase beta subunit|nr:carboxypeptidase-like regulatory domain-containing protein [bacterium]